MAAASVEAIRDRFLSPRVFQSHALGMKRRPLELLAERVRRRWHWDHRLEKGALLRLVESVVGRPDSRHCENACAAF